ncbi:MAG: alpha/beta fold hydrolase [Acidobacteriales bacterium]|nr:alpha/beta fold hydrolase [Candidatus Koribacter versatilis]MBI3645604.1 alpha/beta fold hydrolase [Terriglobales bacterium]
MPTETQKTEEKPGPAETHIRPSTPAWDERWLDLAGGRMRYLQAGSGRALILVHGLMGYSFSWRFTIPALAPHATVYAMDNLGAGLSTAPAGMDCTVRGAAGRVLQFADALGITDFDLLGTSHGGAIAMMAAALAASTPDTRLKRLVLVAPVNPWSRHGRWLAPFVGGDFGSVLFRHTIERWRVLDYLWLRRLFGDGAKIPPDSLEGYRLPVRQNQAFHHAQRIVRTWKADLAELEQILPRIRDYPTLLMWGTRDRAVSFRSAELLGQNFRKSRLVAFQGIGHLPYEEAPEEFNRALIDFLISGM